MVGPYRAKYNITELADSEVHAQLAAEKRKLAIMETVEDDINFIQDIALSKQRIALLEDKVAKDEALTADTSAGATNMAVGKLQTLLGNHITAMTKED